MIKRISSERAPKAVGSYAVATQFKDLIFTSGQLPINPLTGIIDYPESIEKQTEQVMLNLKHILEDNGSNLNNVIKTTVYLSSIEHFKFMDAVYSRYFPDSFPSRSAFEVAALPMGALVEIEVIAARIQTI